MRGQSMSINVIVMIAIALIVLIVLIVVLTGRVQIFGKGLGTCKGNCVLTADQCTGSAIPTPNCDDGGKSAVIPSGGYCCIATA